MLSYGITAVALNSKEVKNFSFAYNSIFVKLFKTNDFNTIALCQYFSHVLPFEYRYDIMRFKFLIKIVDELSANNLFCKPDCTSLTDLCIKYNLNLGDSHNCILKKIWHHFESSLEL